MTRSRGPRSQLRIERLGGFGGFGLPGSGVRAQGSVRTSQLPAHVQATVDELFATAAQPRAATVEPDAFRYRLTRTTPSGQQSVEVPESAVPEQLRAHVRDELV